VQDFLYESYTLILPGEHLKVLTIKSVTFQMLPMMLMHPGLEDTVLASHLCSQMGELSTFGGGAGTGAGGSD
jgi:hypothetical protein